MIAALILAASLAPPPRILRHEAPERRLAAVQARIDRTMDADTVKRLNAEYARLQRELDKRDMAKVKAVSNALEGRLTTSSPPATPCSGLRSWR